MSITHEYTSEAQGKVLAQYTEDKSDVCIIIGPLGSGKTIETCQKAFNIMCDQAPDDRGVRRSRAFAIRNTYGDLLNTTIKDWLGLYEDLGRYKGGGMSPPEHRLNFKLPDGTTVDAELIFIALDRPNCVKKLRGAQLTFVWLNEVKELDKSIFDMAYARCGRFPENPSWYGMIGDTNAPDIDHWLYNLAEKERPQGWAFYKQPGGVVKKGTKPDGRINFVPNLSAENVHNLPPDYYIKNMRGKSDDWISVNLANEYGFVSDGKAIYPEYNDSIHAVEFEFMKDVPIFRGWDFGHPACVMAQYTPKGQLAVRREYTSNQTMGIDRFADHVLNECASLRAKGFKFIDVGDPAGNAKSQQKDEVTCFSILRSKGIDIEPGKQDVTARLEGVRYFLNKLIDGQPAFYIHAVDCPVLRKGFQGAYCYRRIQVAGEKFADKPDKGPSSHPHDGLQYICTYIRNGYDPNEDDYEDYSYPDDTANSVTGY